MPTRRAQSLLLRPRPNPSPSLTRRRLLRQNRTSGNCRRTSAICWHKNALFGSCTGDEKPLSTRFLPCAPVVELVDAPDSKSGTERCVGSSPTGGTKRLFEDDFPLKYSLLNAFSKCVPAHCAISLCHFRPS